MVFGSVAMLGNLFTSIHSARCLRHYHRNLCRYDVDVWTQKSNLLTCKYECAQFFLKIWHEKQIWFACSMNLAFNSDPNIASKPLQTSFHWNQVFLGLYLQLLPTCFIVFQPLLVFVLNISYIRWLLQYITVHTLLLVKKQFNFSTKLLTKR